MQKIMKSLRPVVMSMIVMTVICGIVYTALVTGIAQAVFPNKANGSIIALTLKDGTVREYGSELIEQEFISPQYLIGRPMETTNLAPSGEKQKALVQQRVDFFHSIDPGNTKAIPADLVSASGSGVDPYISPESAEYQVSRIAKARGMGEDAIRKIIAKYTVGKFLGIWGEAGVNVLKVNLALDGLI